MGRGAFIVIVAGRTGKRLSLFASVGTLGKFLGRDFLDLGVELLFEESEGVVDIELVDNLLDVLAVLGNGAGGLLETFVLLLLVLTFLEGVGLAEDALDVVDDVVLGGFDVLDLVKSAVDKLPLERGEVFPCPLGLDALGGHVLVAARGEPALEEGFGQRGGELVDEGFFVLDADHETYHYSMANFTQYFKLQ